MPAQLQIPILTNKDLACPRFVTSSAEGRMTPRVTSGNAPPLTAAAAPGRTAKQGSSPVAIHTTLLMPYPTHIHSFHLNWPVYPYSQGSAHYVAQRTPERQPPCNINMLPALGLQPCPQTCNNRSKAANSQQYPSPPLMPRSSAHAHHGTPWQRNPLDACLGTAVTGPQTGQPCWCASCTGCDSRTHGTAAQEWGVGDRAHKVHQSLKGAPSRTDACPESLLL